MDITGIARIAHLTNKAYCESLQDCSQRPWAEAPQWQRDSAINGVKFHLANPNAEPSASHENWLKEKYADGWKYGEVKDVEKKEHPCCVPFDELPAEQQVKDILFTRIVDTLKLLLT